MARRHATVSGRRCSPSASASRRRSSTCTTRTRARIEDETGEVVGTVDNHLGDTATVTYDREIDYSLEENSEERARARSTRRSSASRTARTASARRCGKPIGEERLEAIPWTRLCIDDARKQDGR